MERMFTLTADSTVDMPESYLKEHEIDIASLGFSINGGFYRDGDPEMSGKKFYDLIRSGAVSTTSQVNVDEFTQFFEKALKRGKDILHVAFSSGLSGTCHSAVIAAKDLEEKYPERKIYVVDSLCASMGQGLLLDFAIGMRDNGKTIEETVQWLEDNKLKLCHCFTVDNLVYLQRGGRISKLTAVVGGLLNVKPILHVDNNGKLVSIGKVRGRRQSLDALVDMMEKLQDGPQKKVFICHGDCEEDARYVADLIKKRFGVTDILYNCIGPVIGGHSGPGTLSVFFMGTHR